MMKQNLRYSSQIQQLQHLPKETIEGKKKNKKSSKAEPKMIPELENHQTNKQTKQV